MTSISGLISPLEFCSQSTRDHTCCPPTPPPVHACSSVHQSVVVGGIEALHTEPPAGGGGSVCSLSCIFLSLSLGAASQVLERHEKEFFEVVDAKVDLFLLLRKKVITESLKVQIESSDNRNAKEILFHHLHHNADVAALRDYCKMAGAADGFPNMQQLGEKMLSELPPEGVLEWCVGECRWVWLGEVVGVNSDTLF